MRWRIAVIWLLVLVIGCPWFQDHAVYSASQNASQGSGAVLVRAVFSFPAWDPTRNAFADWTWVCGVDLEVLVLLAGIALAGPWLCRRSPAGLLRTVVTLGTSVLITVVAGICGSAVLVFDHQVQDSAGLILSFNVSAALWFSLLLAIAFGFILPWPDRNRARATVHFWPSSERKRGISVDGSPVLAPIGSEPGDVTRYLCAAAYIDESFARRVVDDVLADDLSAIAPSAGVDLGPVARHCLAAGEARYERDWRLSVAVGLVILVGPLWLLFGALGLKLAAGVLGHDQHRQDTRGNSEEVPPAALAKGIILTPILLALGVLFGVGLSAIPFPGPLRWFTGSYLLGIPALLVLIFALLLAYSTVARHVLETDRLLRDTMRRPVFSPTALPPAPAQSWLVSRLSAIDQAQDGNVTIYSGYTPTIGYTASQKSWATAVALLPHSPLGRLDGRPAEVTEFALTELVDHVREHLRDIAAREAGTPAAEGAIRLDTLTVEDRVFVNGAALASDDRFVTEPHSVPSTRLSPEQVQHIVLHPTGTVRHYLAMHVPLWGGDIVPTVFMHFSTAGNTLHLQWSYHVLGPVDRAYHVVDRLPEQLTPQRRGRLLLTAIAELSSTLLRAPSQAVRHARLDHRWRKRVRRDFLAVDHDPMFDYGARLSIRELALSPNYFNYFQPVDASRIISAVELHALASILEFLDAHGVDTTDLRSQQQTILNQGIIQSGGVSNIGAQAVGQGANAVQQQAETGGPGPARFLAGLRGSRAPQDGAGT